MKHPLLEQAVSLHQAGRFAEAVEIYNRIVSEIPDHFDATHLLGVIALQEGCLEQAHDLIKSALRINSKSAPALNNLGMVYLRQGGLELACRQFELAVQIQPKFSDALANLGTVLRRLGRPYEALVPLRRAHSGNSESATVCNLIGACLMDTGQQHAAVKFFEAATRAEPDDADGWSNLAMALNSIGETERAQLLADKAVEMRPGSSAALGARAAVEFGEGFVETAIETYREAMSLPDASTQIRCAFANALWISGRCKEALECLRQSVELDASNATARWKLAISECRPFYSTAAEIEASREAFSAQLLDLEAWFRAGRRPEAYRVVGSTQPFFIAYQPFNNRDLLSRYGKLCSELMATMTFDAPLTRGQREGPRNSFSMERKIRVGIASAHIRNHSVWNAITKGWVQQLDRARFEIWLFQLGSTSDEETARARSQVAHFEEGPKTDQGWARAISEAHLDALIYPEIGMDALTTQLASLRLSPVQAASWGHPETTGLPTIDLYLSADGLEPPDADRNYSERLVLLPNLGVCVEPLVPAISVPDLKSLGLPSDEPLILCPGTPSKYSPLHDHLWARIAKGLQAVSRTGGWGRLTGRLGRKGHGRLVFFGTNNVSMDKLLAQRLRLAFNVENVDFDARVCMIPYLDRPRYFGLMQQAALLLDTVDFSGFNNALQAIEAGLPVLARESRFMRGRLASGIMRRMELTGLVATTDEEFIRTAIELAGDISKRTELRAEIANRRKILFHDTEPVRALERCLVEAIENSRGTAVVAS